MILTCIECPMGCELEIQTLEGKVVSVEGNGCPRGKTYAENEVICPRRVLTTSIRATNGKMVSVKTDAPIKKSDIFCVMEKINQLTIKTPVNIGQIIVNNIVEEINLISTSKIV